MIYHTDWTTPNISSSSTSMDSDVEDDSPFFVCFVTTYNQFWIQLKLQFPSTLQDYAKYNLKATYIIFMFINLLVLHEDGQLWKRWPSFPYLLTCISTSSVVVDNFFVVIFVVLSLVISSSSVVVEGTIEVVEEWLEVGGLILFALISVVITAVVAVGVVVVSSSSVVVSSLRVVVDGTTVVEGTSVVDTSLVVVSSFFIVVFSLLRVVDGTVEVEGISVLVISTVDISSFFDPSVVLLLPSSVLVDASVVLVDASVVLVVVVAFGRCHTIHGQNLPVMRIILAQLWSCTRCASWMETRRERVNNRSPRENMVDSMEIVPFLGSGDRHSFPFSHLSLSLSNHSPFCICLPTIRWTLLTPHNLLLPLSVTMNPGWTLFLVPLSPSLPSLSLLCSPLDSLFWSHRNVSHRSLGANKKEGSPIHSKSANEDDCWRRMDMA